MTSAEVWSAQELGGDRVEFTNVYGARLVAVTISPIGRGTVAVVDHQIDAEAVDTPVDAGASFAVIVRAPGLRIMATDPDSRSHISWEWHR